MSDKIVFTLEDEELERANEWIQKQKKEHGKKVGSMGDRFSYIFSPTGLGTIILVQDHLTGEKEDVTNYDLW